MAIGIWLSVHKFSETGVAPGLLSVENTFTNVPIMLVSSTPDSRGMSALPDTVTVAVSASQDVMASLDADRLHAFVNITGMDATHGLIRHVEVATPPRVTILNINPPTVTVIPSK